MISNFVRCQISAISASDTSISLTVQSPFNPPNGDNQYERRATIINDITNPTEFEVVSYTGVSGSSGSFTLTGVTRGLEGTSSRSWDSGSFLIQDVTSYGLDYLRLSHYSAVICTCSKDTSSKTLNKSLQTVSTYQDHNDDVIDCDKGFDFKTYTLSMDGTVKVRNDSGTTLLTVSVSINDDFVPLHFIKSMSDGSFVYCSYKTVKRYSSSGSEVWTKTIADEIRSVDIDRDDKVYLSTSGAEVRVLLSDGVDYMIMDNFTFVAESLHVSDRDRLYVSDANFIRCLNLAGRVLWQHTTTGTARHITSSYDRDVYYVTGNRTVVVIDDLRNEISSTTLVDDINSMDIDNEGNFYVATGRKVIKYSRMGTKIAEETVHDSTVQKIFCLNLNGSVKVTTSSTGMSLERMSMSDIQGTQISDIVVIEETPYEPESPRSGEAYLFYDGTNLKLKKSDGSVEVLG